MANFSTAFVNKPFASTFTLAYDALNPNIEINVTGNINITVTGSTSGNSGLVNLYFTGTQTATLNGVENLVITGESKLFPVYFIRSSDGVRFYKYKNESDLAGAVALNTAKISFDSTSSTRLANTSGTNTGNQDLTPYATVINLALKVDKVTGKSLINDTEITRLASVVNFDNSANVSSLALKVDKVAGKGLSTEDFLTAEKAKLSALLQINSAFTQKTFASVMSVAFDATNPNFFINVTSDFSLSITGTVNGDSGMINLNFAGTQIATLNSTINKIITGASATIQVYFIHDSQGLKWYRDEVGGAAVDTTLFAKIDGTILYHAYVAASVGTISNVGTSCTGTGTTITALSVGSKITKANGETAIIATRTSNTAFTTVLPFTTNSTGVTFSITHRQSQILANGNVSYFDAIEGSERMVMESNGFVSINNQQFRQNNTVFFAAGLINMNAILEVFSSTISLTLPSYASDSAASADTNLPVKSVYVLSTDTVLHIKK